MDYWTLTYLNYFDCCFLHVKFPENWKSFWTSTKITFYYSLFRLENLTTNRWLKNRVYIHLQASPRLKVVIGVTHVIYFLLLCDINNQHDQVSHIICILCFRNVNGSKIGWNFWDLTSPITQLNGSRFVHLPRLPVFTQPLQDCLLSRWIIFDRLNHIWVRTRDPLPWFILGNVVCVTYTQ